MEIILANAEGLFVLLSIVDGYLMRRKESVLKQIFFKNYNIS